MVLVVVDVDIVVVGDAVFGCEVALGVDIVVVVALVDAAWCWGCMWLGIVDNVLVVLIAEAVVFGIVELLGL